MSGKTVQIRWGPVQCRVETRIDKGLNDLIYGECSYEIANAEHIIRATGGGRYGNWDGWKRLYHRTRRTFPTGLLDRVRRLLSTQGYTAVVEGAAHGIPADHGPMVVPDDYALWDYQQEAVRTMLDTRRCMVQVATGGGKTVIAGHVLARVCLQSVFLVHTKDLLYQAREMLGAMLGRGVVGQIGDGVVEIRPVTVATLQTAARCLDVEYHPYEYDEDGFWDDAETATKAEERVRVRTLLDRAGCVFMDECHRVGAPMAQQVVMAMERAVFRFGLSASPWRDDGADLLLEGTFGHVAVRVSASELADRGYLVRPLIRFADTVPAVYPKGTRYQTVYNEYIAANFERNQMAVHRTLDMVRRGRPTLVLARLISHGETLQRLLQERGLAVPFLSGRDSSSYRTQVLRDLREGRLSALVASTIADEGLDIKPLSGLVLAGGGKSSTRALQRIGRVLRIFPGKRDAEVVDFDDNARYLAAHSAARARIYRSEPAWTITDV